MAEKPRRVLTVRTNVDYVYDPVRVEEFYTQLQPDPELHGEDHAYAVWSVLHDSLLGADVFEDQGTFDQWAKRDEEYDPDA